MYGLSKKTAAKRNCVPCGTLQQHVKKCAENRRTQQNVFIECGAENDKRRSDDWLKCQVCSWLHESCAEILRIIYDNGFTCKAYSD